MPVVCQLVGVNDEQCLNCGRRRPGLWGFAPLLQALGREDMGFVPFVLWACGVLYIATLVMDPEAIGMRGLNLLSPGIKGMRLGPTLPALLTPNVVKVLVDTFDLKPNTTPNQDLAAILG